MGAVGLKTLADLGRRRLQSVVIAVVLFLACGAAALSLNILVAAREPFDRAFASARGAHLAIDFDRSVSISDLSATATTDAVTAAAGPWPVGTVAFEHGKGGLVLDQVVSARPRPDPGIDSVTMMSGRWWQATGEVVLDQDAALLLDGTVGSIVSFFPAPQMSKPDGGGDRRPVEATEPGLPPLGKPELPDPGSATTLTVVGIAGSVSTPDVAAWLSPDDLETLTRDTPTGQQMLYRVEPASTESDLVAATGMIVEGLPAGAMLDSTTYLQVRAGVSQTADLYVPILLAFAVFALLAAAFTIANVVSGIVLSGTRDVGVMKAVGFTPGQVTAILLGQILVPVTIGAIAGVVLGTLVSQPVVERTTQSFGLPATFTASPAVMAFVIAAGWLVATIAALVPAVHAGRLSAVEAITRGSAPASGPLGARIRRTGLQLPVGLPVRLGFTTIAAHPGRAAMTIGALVVGVAAITFAWGVDLSVVRAVTQLDRGAASPVRVEAIADDRAALTPLVADDPATGRYVSVAQREVAVVGLGTLPFVAYDGDSSWVGYAIIRGRWFAGPGEAVAPTNVFRTGGLELGDRVELTMAGRTVAVTLVGEIFDVAEESEEHLVIRGSWTDLAAFEAGLRPARWEVQPVAGVTPQQSRDSLIDRSGGSLAAYTIDDPANDESFLLFLSVVAFLGVVLVAISFGGVFNTVLLETRQRTREIAVLKALGMTPAQSVAMVVSSILALGLAAGLVGVPLGLAFQRAVVSHMGETAARLAVPESTFDVLPPLMLLAFACSGVAIAAVGAFLPARRAARAPIAPVLQVE